MLPDVGDRIELMAMPSDPDPIPPGTRGIVTGIHEDPWGTQIGVQWDNGRTLSLIHGVDDYRVVEPRRAPT